MVSTLHYVVGIGLPLGSLPLVGYMLGRGELPQAFSIRFYGGGFIERQAGFEGVVAAAVAYLVTSALYVLAAYWLARGMRLGAVLSLVLFPVNMFFALGFLAPIPIIVHPLLALVVVAAWGSLI
jgi:hypothetical protein